MATKVQNLTPEQAESVSNSSPFFRDMLASQRTTFLFEKVFKLVTSSVLEKELYQKLEIIPFQNWDFWRKLTCPTYLFPLFQQFITANNHVSTLFVDYTKENNVFTVELPNLTFFQLRDCPNDIVEKLGSPQVTWPLEKLELQDVRNPALAPLFQVIQDKFADTLVSLNLEIIGQGADPVDMSIWSQCKNLRLDLPKLKNISLDIFASPVCLDLDLDLDFQWKTIWRRLQWVMAISPHSSSPFQVWAASNMLALRRECSSQIFGRFLKIWTNL